VTSKERRNARRGGGRMAAGSLPRPTRNREGAGHPTEAGSWVWGWHSVLAALDNPARQGPRRLFASPERTRRLSELGVATPIEILEPAAWRTVLPPGAAHQGVALLASPPEPVSIDVLARPADGVLLVLDQVTDPQNVGAIFRSAAAFGARGVVLQARHAPPLVGALAKAAAGAVDTLPHAREVNLARALERLETLGWRAVGLAPDASEDIAQTLDGGPTVLVLGAEGEGLRRLVREHCDTVAAITLASGLQSLNVAAAAAIALFQAARARRP
jgi:23S rRNA (guanosine2251-2'-O)-methyltransferase